MSQDWYYSVDGDRQGPVASAELKKLADAGTLKPTDLVWKDGMADWAPAKSLKGLFGGATATPAAGTPAARAEEPAAKAEPEPVEEADDERPSSRKRTREPEPAEEEERPRRRRDAEEEEDERPSRSRRRGGDEEEEERPVRRRRDEDEEVGRRPKKKKRGGRVPEDISSKKTTAGLLGILIGWTGAHRFYLGDTDGGLIRLLVLNLVCAGGIVGLIEGIIYLTKSDEDFYQTYIVEQKGWF